MAFVKTTWVDNQAPAITAAQLNRIENGIEEASESSKAIVLTQAQYDALSDAEKDSDNVYYISDAPFESSNIVPCTRAEYNAMSTATKMDGRFYYVTDDAEVDTSLIVDNLTTDNAGYALSAKQGKVLNDSFVNGLKDNITITASMVSDFLKQTADHAISLGIGSHVFTATWYQHYATTVVSGVHSSTRCQCLVVPQAENTSYTFVVSLNNSTYTYRQITMSNLT